MKVVKKNKSKKYLIYCILFSVLILFGIILYVYIHRSNSNSLSDEKSFYPYKYFKSLNIKDISFTNREYLIIEEYNLVLIGRNKKELENGYYDIKFSITKDNICLTINNLQKEDINFKSISDEYLKELKVFLSVLLNNKNLDKLVDVIKEEYVDLRDNLYMENKINYNQINIDEYMIVFNIENNMLRINIQI